MKKKLINKFIYLINIPRIVIYRILSSSYPNVKLVNIRQPLMCVGVGEIVFSENVTIGVFPSPYFLNTVCYLEARGVKSRICIGKNTSINNEFTAIAEHSSIEIGERCLIGTRCTIYDSDFHPLRSEDRCESSKTKFKSVSVGDDVFIGSNVTILKGAKIGCGVVIAAGSVVVGDIPPRVVIAGTPAQIIYNL